MLTVEQIKHNGMIKALKENINDLIYEIKRKIWENVKYPFYGLYNALDETKETTEQILKLYNELCKLEGFGDIEEEKDDNPFERIFKLGTSKQQKD